MVADIPAMNDEIRHEESVAPLSRQWYWNSWTWLGGLALFVMLVLFFETRLLWHEDVIAQQLQRRGYGVDWSDGWLHQFIPARLRFASHFVGDHVVGLNFHSEHSGQQPLDDLIPELRRLPRFCGVTLSAPDSGGVHSTAATASIGDMTRRLAALKEVGGVRFACLCGFTELTLTDDVIQSLQLLEVEYVSLFITKSDFANKSKDECMKRLQVLRRLKALNFIWHEPSKEFLDAFKNARPDVKVQSTPFVKTVK